MVVGGGKVEIDQYLKEYSELYKINVLNCNNLNRKIYFYSDESGNSRNFNINKERYNESVQTQFTLGGLATKEKVNEDDVRALFDSLDLQSNVKEVKFKHVSNSKKKSNGNFLEEINNPKLLIVMEWLLKKENWFLQYDNLNLFYYAVVDIVDSLCVSQENTDCYEEYTIVLKNYIYKNLIQESEYWCKIFYQHGYPDLKKDDILDFCEKLETFLENRDTEDKMDRFAQKELKKLFELAKEKQSLPFIQENKKHILINSFKDIFLNKIILFDNSKIILDCEDQIKKEFTELGIDMSYLSQRYMFVNSKEYLIIQLCDIVVGFVNRLYFYLASKSIEQLRIEISSMSFEENNFNVLCCFFELIDKSDKEEPAFISSSSVLSEYEKFNYLYNFFC